MKHNLEVSNNCVVCGNELSKEHKKNLKNSDEFCQSWCLTCTLKHAHSHPTTDLKINAIQEINKLERQNKYSKAL
jgi:hypothetical protein